MKNQTSRYDILFTKLSTHVQEAQRFRQRIFRKSYEGLDRDQFDNNSIHCLIFDKKFEGQLVLVFRITNFPSMAQIVNSYSAQFYDLTKLSQYPFNPLELGRFCVNPSSKDPLLVLTAIKFLSSYIKKNKRNFLFGCSSFEGCDSNSHLASFSYLRTNYLAADNFIIGTKAREVIKFSSIKTEKLSNTYDYRKNLPTLLKFYLRIGGKVSDHAVIDRDLNTLHVFTYVKL